MRAYIHLCLLVTMSCLLPACGMRDNFPVIVCELNGKIVPTAFTFGSFRKNLETEHGQVAAEQNVSLKSRSLEVYFRRLTDGRLLAERVVLSRTGKTISPAVFFGLTNAVSHAGGAGQNAE